MNAHRSSFKSVIKILGFVIVLLITYPSNTNPKILVWKVSHDQVFSEAAKTKWMAHDSYN